MQATAPEMASTASAPVSGATTFEPVFGVATGQLQGFVAKPGSELTDFEALEIVLDQLMRWQRIFTHDAPTIATNVTSSVEALEALDYIVRGQLRRFDVDPRGLVLQLCEADAVGSIGTATATQLRSLSDLGVQVSIVDFGTGFTSLQQLRAISAQALQIHASFIEEIGHDPEAIGFTRAIVEVGRSFGLTTIADGVTSDEQQLILRSIGCDQMQGTSVSTPLTSLEATDLIESAPKNRW